MEERASTAQDQPITADLQKEAVDALAQLKQGEAEDTLDYFKALLAFQKHASTTRQRVQ